MSRLTIKKFHGKNYGPFKDFELEVKPGMHLVIGENNASSTESSNASGKSFLMESPGATLFKRFIRGETPIKIGTSKAEIGIEFEKDGSEYKVQRYLGHDGPNKSNPEIHINGIMSQERKKSANEAEIQKILGYTPDMFYSTVFAAQGLPDNFCTLSKTDRKVIFEQALGFEWKKYKSQFEKLAKAKTKEKQQLSTEYHSAREELAYCKAKLEQMIETAKAMEEDFTEEMMEYQDKKEMLEDSVSDAVSLEEELSKVESEFTSMSLKSSGWLERN